MINKLKTELRNEILKEARYISERRIESDLIYLFALKYNCDNFLLTYEQIKNEIDTINIEKELIIYTEDIKKIAKLLPLIEHIDLKELLNEYLDNSEIAYNLIDKSTKKVCISKEFEKFLYDKEGNTIYITDKFKVPYIDIKKYQLFDKILNINNKYIKYDELLNNNYEYEYVYIYDNIPKYRFIKEVDYDLNSIIRKLIYKKDEPKIILHTEYKKIANIKQLKNIIQYLSKVILDDETAYLFYEKKKDDKVSIINYNKEKITSIESLKKIIENNRKQKDVLVKTTEKDIANNFFRVGFKLYQLNIIEKTRNINEIVDENTKLIEELSIINKKIEIEINKLINK